MRGVAAIIEPAVDIKRLTKQVSAAHVALQDAERSADKAEARAKIASFSGLGAKAGGPIGGRKQSSKFNVECRWNATRHIREVQRLHKLLSRFQSVKISSGDFAKLIDDAPSNAFIYADPPYYEKGEQLYKHCMSDEDHTRLAASFRNCRASWVLSYDDHEKIRNLYPWADIENIEMTYTIASAKETRRKNHEVVIKPRLTLRAVG